jgi:hypothetical protein
MYPCVNLMRHLIPNGLADKEREGGVKLLSTVHNRRIVDGTASLR